MAIGLPIFSNQVDFFNAVLNRKKQKIIEGKERWQEEGVSILFA